MSGWVSKCRKLGWPVAEQFASPLTQLVITPVLLHRMDAEQFALWVVVQSLVVAAPTLSLGRSAALLTVIPRISETDREGRAAALVNQTLRLITLVSMIAALVVVLTGSLFGHAWPWLVGAKTFLILTILFLAVTEAESTLGSTLKSYHAFDQTAVIEIVGRACQLFLVLSIIAVGSSALEVILIAIVVGLAKLVAKAVALRRRQSPAAECIVLEDSYRDMKRLGFWSWMQVLSGIVFYSFDRWVVGYFMGSVALASYSVCNQLAQLTHAVPAAAAQTLIPWASRSTAVSKSVQGSRLRSVAIAGAFLASLPALIVLAIAPQLLAVWISPSFSAEYAPLLRHLAFMFLILSINIPFFNIMIGLGYARWTALLSLFAGVAYAVATLWLEPRNLVTMADLKLIYALISLTLIAKLLQILKKVNAL